MTRIAVTFNERVTNVQRIVLACDGIAKEVQRASLACGGLAFEVWPSDSPGGDAIFWTDETLNVSQEAISPDTADANITFAVATGQYFYTLSGGQGSGTYLNPTVDALGQYLIRVDEVSGTILGNATGVWIDLFSLGQDGVFAWFISQASVGDSSGEVDISISADAGGGTPNPATTVVKRVNFFAQVLQGNLTLTSEPWELESITVDIDGITKVLFQTDRTMNGFGVTSGDFSESYAPSGDPANYEVLATQISGDPVDGVFDVPLNLGSEHEWTLTADTAGQDFSAQVQFDVTIDAEIATKLVSFHSARVDTGDPNIVWPPTGASVVDQAVSANGPARCSIQMFNTGDSLGTALINGSQFTDPWHGDAPVVSDPQNYEVKLDIDAFSDDPSIGSDQDGVWLNLATDRNWEWDSPSQGLVPFLFANTIVTVRRVGQASTEEPRPIIVIVNPQNTP